jgi:hypothetical protein
VRTYGGELFPKRGQSFQWVMSPTIHLLVLSSWKILLITNTRFSKRVRWKALSIAISVAFEVVDGN